MTHRFDQPYQPYRIHKGFKPTMSRCHLLHQAASSAGTFLRCLYSLAADAAIVSMSYDDIEIEDMEWNEELSAFTYPCPCGDLFQITKVLDLPVVGQDVSILPAAYGVISPALTVRGCAGRAC